MRYTRLVVALATAGLLAWWSYDNGGKSDGHLGLSVAMADGVVADNAVETLTRGPVHEAFAEPVSLAMTARRTITRQPPPPLVEQPPAEMPQNSNMAWIAGYWTWSRERNDFIWITGCWRVVPPGCTWVPGYWVEVPGGWQWSDGFWQVGDATELEYLPPPPETEEDGPPSASPAADVIWTPGCWIWTGRQYAWRPGAWLPAQADWVWVPAHYEYTPRGCVFIEGYWDYPLERRGVLFLPVYCPPGLYGRHGFTFTPSLVLELDVLLGNMFCGPHYGHYYFGDFYGDEYEQRGIYPWYEARAHRHDWYDPIFVHQEWQHRKDAHWMDGMRSEYRRRNQDPKARPARTYAELETQLRGMPEARRKDYTLARPVTKMAEDKNAAFRFQTLDEKRRGEASKSSRDVDAYREQRRQWEAPTVAPVAKPMEHPTVPMTPMEHGKPSGHSNDNNTNAKTLDHTGTAKPMDHATTSGHPGESVTNAKPLDHTGTAKPMEHVETVKSTEHAAPLPEVRDLPRAGVTAGKIQIPPSPITHKADNTWQKSAPPRPEMPKPDANFPARTHQAPVEAAPHGPVATPAADASKHDDHHGH